MISNNEGDAVDLLEQLLSETVQDVKAAVNREASEAGHKQSANQVRNVNVSLGIEDN